MMSMNCFRMKLPNDMRASSYFRGSLRQLPLKAKPKPGLGTPDQLIGRPGRVDYLPGSFHTDHRKLCFIEQSKLNENRRLIPIDALADDLIAFDLADHN